HHCRLRMDQPDDCNPRPHRHRLPHHNARASTHRTPHKLDESPLSNSNSPFSRIVPSEPESLHARVDMTPRFLSLGEECLSRRLVTLAMLLFLLGFLLVRLQFS